MSKYTTELRFICEKAAGLDESKGYSQVNSIIEAAAPVIFDFDFPIWDIAYKPVLEKKILKHYYTREIGFETVGLWKLKLDTKLNEIMPRYNKLYETTVLEFNPLYDVDLQTVHAGAGTNTGTDATVTAGVKASSENGTIGDNLNKTTTRADNLTSSEQLTGSDTNTLNKRGGNTRKDIYSDTPQGALTNVDNETYLTNYRKILDDENSTDTSITSYGRNNTTTDTGTQTTTETGGNTRTLNTVKTDRDDTTLTKTLNLANTDEYVNHVIGKSAGSSYADMLLKFRDTIIDIDMMIIRDLAPLFMGLW